MTPAEPTSAAPTPVDPFPILKGFASLRKLAGTYPAGHPMITQKLQELDDAVQQHLKANPAFRIEMIHGNVFLDGVSFSRDHQANTQIIHELSDLGIDSIHIYEGVHPDELRSVAEFLWQLKEGPQSQPIAAQLTERHVRHVSLGTLVPLDTRWRAQQWPDAPTGPLDPAYAESLQRAEQTFETVTAGQQLDVVTVRDLVQLLIYKVARSNAALGQILAVKQYENLTYCHSVNVAILSLLIGKQLRLDEATMAELVEAAVLHDIGKTRIPLGVLKKPGALDKRERKLMEAHTVLGSEILVQIEGLWSLTPIVALEHHRGLKGTGYPDVGDGVVPHVMSQIVSVADVYEAITGARSYQDPTLPERACLVLARLAGHKLNTALVKAFVNAITFFPLGSLVRTTRDEIGIVTRTNSSDPLHPVLTLVDEALDGARGQIDTSTRDSSGGYERHIVETLVPHTELDVTRFLEMTPANA
jgi:HD-GYP domain-containing protein (c-di-GMP phosphodiesterase class II)